MSGCSRSHCYAPAVACNLGYSTFSECPNWKTDESGARQASSTTSSTLLPWTSSAFGIDDLEFVSFSRRPILIAVVGAYGAGKTTLLVATYLMLLRGFSPEGYRFAGSYTLGGWENLASWLRWSPDGSSPSFPPHTPFGTGRNPGLLHLAFRTAHGRLRDVLFTDAPGEWFERWGFDADDKTAEGARWISRHADAFMILIDQSALAGEGRSDARLALNALVNRVADVKGPRPLAAVRTKTDVVLPDTMEQHISELMKRKLPSRVEFSVSVKGGANSHGGPSTLIDVLAFAMKQPATKTSRVPTLASSYPDDPFLSFRGK